MILKVLVDFETLMVLYLLELYLYMQKFKDYHLIIFIYVLLITCTIIFGFNPGL